MRRFACRNFQFATELYSKLSYTPCYNQYGKLVPNLIRRTNKKFLKISDGNNTFN